MSSERLKMTHVGLCVATPANLRLLAGLRKVLTWLSPLANITCAGGQASVKCLVVRVCWYEANAYADGVRLAATLSQQRAGTVLTAYKDDNLFDVWRCCQPMHDRAHMDAGLEPHRLSALEARHVHGGVLRGPRRPGALDRSHAGTGGPVTEGRCRLNKRQAQDQLHSRRLFCGAFARVTDPHKTQCAGLVRVEQGWTQPGGHNDKAVLDLPLCAALGMCSARVTLWQRPRGRGGTNDAALQLRCKRFCTPALR